MMQSSPVLSLFPSFTTSYSSSRLAEIAARVVEEFRADGIHPDMDHDEFSYPFCGADFEEGFDEELKSEAKEEVGGDTGSCDNGDEEGEEEFEFAVFARDFVSSPTPADEIFHNGQIRPVYPVFNRDLISHGDDFGERNGNFSHEKSISATEEAPPSTKAIRLPLRKLFIEERESASSCSSSEADDLDGVPADTYCVWAPKSPVEAPATEGQCKKSNSTGSSKRWKFRDLLHRSHSDGKNRFVFLAPPNARDNSSNSNGKKTEEKIEKIKKTVATEEVPKVPGKFMVPLKNGGDRRRSSFLPYRQDLVGFFTNVNGLSRNLHPF